MSNGLKMQQTAQMYPKRFHCVCCACQWHFFSIIYNSIATRESRDICGCNDMTLLEHGTSINLPCILSPVHHVLDLVFVCDKIDPHQSSVTVAGVKSLETMAKVALYSQACQAAAQVLQTHKFYSLVQVSLIFIDNGFKSPIKH